MAELLRAVRLRHQYLIYQEDQGYRVDRIDRNGQTHSVAVPLEIVEYLYHALEGSRVDAKQAQLVLQNVPEAEHLTLPPVRGPRLLHYAQDVLLVMVALKKAACMDVNHQFIYTIGA